MWSWGFQLTELYFGATHCTMILLWFIAPILWTLYFQGFALFTSSSESIFTWFSGSAQIEEPPNDLITTEGKSVNLTCTASGQPRPTIQWWRLLNATQQPTNFTSVETNTSSNTFSTLLLKSISAEDEGEYVCVASNVVESQTLSNSDKATVRVYSKFNPFRANYCHTWHMKNHPFLWRRIRRVRRIQVCMARKGLWW